MDKWSLTWKEGDIHVRIVTDRDRKGHTWTDRDSQGQTGTARDRQ